MSLYPRAPVSLVLRAWDRNSSEVDSLENRISAVSRDWFGGAFPALHDRKIQFAAEFIYFTATLLLGKTTLGEEQAGLALVQPQLVTSAFPTNSALSSSSSSAILSSAAASSSLVVPTTRIFLLPPSRIRLILSFAAHLVVPHILRRIWEYLFPEQDSSDGVRRVLLVHSAWWWLWSSANSLRSWVPESFASRISGLTLVSTDLKLFQASQQQSSSEQYTFLGGLTLFRIAVELFIWGKEKWRNRRVDRTPQNNNGNDDDHDANTAPGQQRRHQQGNNGENQSSGNNNSEQHQQGDGNNNNNNHNSQPPANTGTCPLCLAQRINPTATSCGHVFCWNCLSELLESGAGGVEPRCPLCREVVKPQGFVLLQNFAVPKN